MIHQESVFKSSHLRYVQLTRLRRERRGACKQEATLPLPSLHLTLGFECWKVQMEISIGISATIPLSVNIYKNCWHMIKDLRRWVEHVDQNEAERDEENNPGGDNVLKAESKKLANCEWPEEQMLCSGTNSCKTLPEGKTQNTPCYALCRNLVIIHWINPTMLMS